ncbi:glycosyltransferase [Flavobacterium sp. F-380]|uniref:Glycosyltransferase n=1 Tax=Flavobacterium kayseriense TaxID=2764714 RepID=A0ABR7J7F3_9FLAO|nr:glycosyltransferase [Flavobacterium kayseriense]MBC5841474.1 glycosyltransferase [Flavobacterium kayseriense]MBC5848002.1 glycosyltransferase [Flavobacterium kayseriense]
MERPQISVIVPVYNVEKYIEDCVNSLLNQTFKQCEFIFVNDGSTDKSAVLIASFAEKDSRIILLNQQNKGVSVARNQGLAIARGKYIGFVDADDWVEHDLYQKLFDNMETHQVDLVLYNMFSYVDGKQYDTAYDFPAATVLGLDFIQNELWRHLIEKDDLYSSCNKLFKASIINENKIIFPPGNALSEDNVFNLKYFNKIKQFLYLDYTGYHYREVAGSAMRSVLKKDYFDNIIKLYQVDFKVFLDLKLSEVEIKEIQSEKLINNTLSLIHFYLIPTTELSLRKRLLIVKKMVSNEQVTMVLDKQYQKLYAKKGRFDKFILKAVKNQNILQIYIATSYSRHRNK